MESWNDYFKVTSHFFYREWDWWFWLIWLVLISVSPFAPPWHVEDCYLGFLPLGVICDEWLRDGQWSVDISDVSFRLKHARVKCDVLMCPFLQLQTLEGPPLEKTEFLASVKPWVQTPVLQRKIHTQRDRERKQNNKTKGAWILQTTKGKTFALECCLSLGQNLHKMTSKFW
jgi:hypothetical protein